MIMCLKMGTVVMIIAIRMMIPFTFQNKAVSLPGRQPEPLSTPQPEFKHGGSYWRKCLLLHRLIIEGKGEEVLRRRQELNPSILQHTCNGEVRQRESDWGFRLWDKILNTATRFPMQILNFLDFFEFLSFKNYFSSKRTDSHSSNCLHFTISHSVDRSPPRCRIQVLRPSGDRSAGGRLGSQSERWWGMVSSPFCRQLG